MASTMTAAGIASTGATPGPAATASAASATSTAALRECVAGDQHESQRRQKDCAKNHAGTSFPRPLRSIIGASAAPRKCPTRRHSAQMELEGIGQAT